MHTGQCVVWCGVCTGSRCVAHTAVPVAARLAGRLRPSSNKRQASRGRADVCACVALQRSTDTPLVFATLRAANYSPAEQTALPNIPGCPLAYPSQPAHLHQRAAQLHRMLTAALPHLHSAAAEQAPQPSSCQPRPPLAMAQGRASKGWR